MENQEKHGLGKGVVEKLAKDRQIEFPESKSYSVRNLRHMRNFYLTYVEFPNLYTLCTQLGWSNNRTLLTDKLDLSAKAYYLEHAVAENWSSRTLSRIIKKQSYERSLLDPSQNNFRATLPEELAEQTEELIKSTYNLDFLCCCVPRKMTLKWNTPSAEQPARWAS